MTKRTITIRFSVDKNGKRRATKNAGLARRLRATRIALGLSKEEAADAAGCSIETWRRYETSGEGHITAPLLAFAKRHRLRIDWLVTGKNNAAMLARY